MAGTGRRGRGAVLTTLDSVLFLFAGLSAAWLAYLLLREGLQFDWRIVLVGVFWVLVAYLVLPRMHRVLTYLYLPDYFIGRTRTSDGLLGDPVNLALLGTRTQVGAVMDAAGWTRADEVSLRSGARIVTSTVSRRSYAEAPVSPLNLFGRPQDFAYQQEVAGSPSKRHHVRFWRCPDGWLLPGGYAVDWLAAGTYDRSVGLSLWTFQVTHRIAQDVDTERDYIVASVTGADPAAAVQHIENFSTGYHSRNGGGDRIETDGDLPVLDLRALAVLEPSTPMVSDRRRRAPAPTVFGSAVAGLRGLVYLFSATALLVSPGTASVPAQLTAPVPVLIAVLLASGLLDLLLAVATYAGRNWARLVLMLESVVAILESFSLTQSSGIRPTLGHSLPAVALSILLLLALTSHRARDFAIERRLRAGPEASPPDVVPTSRPAGTPTVG